jgi:hypothetical protein
LAEWKVGEVRQGPFTVTVPEGLSGEYDIYMGLFASPGLERAPLIDVRSGQRRVLVGRLKVTGDHIVFESPRTSPAKPTGDPGLFVRAENGWAAGLHPMDRFLKNTHEILSPLNELTSQLPMTQHELLTPDRKVQRSVFGEGQNAVKVLVNAGTKDYRHQSDLGGEVVLPPYGFIVEAPSFIAFHALSWGGLRYEAPAMFTLRTPTGTRLSQANRVKVFHAFGDARLKVNGSMRTVEKEAVLAVE